MDNNNYSNNSNINNNNANNTTNGSYGSNNYGTGNQSTDSFYSYNYQQNNANQESAQAGVYGNNTSQTSGQQNANPYQGNTYGSGSTYQNNSSAYQNSGSTYQNGSSAYQNSNYGTGAYQQTTGTGKAPKQPRKKRERKPGNFGTQIAKCAALALVFGLVAGGVMTGVNYAGGKVLGTTTTSASASLTTSNSTAVKPTSTSSTYVATDVSDIVAESMPSIVAITNVSETEYQSFWGQSQTYESTSCGSGIIVSQDSEYLYIATNNHVVEGSNSLTVTFADDSTVSAEIKGTDSSTDLAVVKVALSSIEDATMSAIKVATLGDSDILKVGESCIAIGNALGYGQSVTTGVISALNREVSVSDSTSSTSYTAELIQTDAAINPGNSGGALLNTAGEVIGINSVKYSETSVEGIGYAIPMNTASPIIEELITKEKVDESDSAYLGIAGVDVTSDVASKYNMPTGVYVAQVMQNSAAQQSGIQQGDIITTFDGKAISSMEELSSTMEYYSAGTVVDVVVQRSSNGQYTEQTISVTLGNKN